MKPEPLDKKLDDWLDRTLAEYGRAEPRPGLESRTIYALSRRMEAKPRWRRWPRMVWISAAAAAIILVLVIVVPRREPPQVPTLSDRNDRELLIGVDRLLNKEVPSALEPALLLTKEITKQQ